MKRYAKLAVILLVMWDFLDPAHGIMTAETAAAQIPLIVGPQDVAGLNNTLNKLINQINSSALITFGAVSAAPPQYFGATVNGAQFVGTIAGFGTQPAFGVQLNTTGTDANINLVLNPKGTGVIEFANPNNFVSTNGLAACPGYQVNQVRPIGISATIQGYVPILDWMGRAHWIPTC
jgi:hypothetical protein